MKKSIVILVILFLSLYIYSCNTEPCTEEIDTMFGPQTIEVDCEFANNF